MRESSLLECCWKEIVFKGKAIESVKKKERAFQFQSPLFEDEVLHHMALILSS
jgi:hypothetical protein